MVSFLFDVMYVSHDPYYTADAKTLPVWQDKEYRQVTEGRQVGGKQRDDGLPWLQVPAVERHGGTETHERKIDNSPNETELLHDVGNVEELE